MRDLHRELGKAKGERFGGKVLGHLKQVLKNRIDSKTEGREIYQRNNTSETGLARPCRFKFVVEKGQDRGDVSQQA